MNDPRSRLARLASIATEFFTSVWNNVPEKVRLPDEERWPEEYPVVFVEEPFTYEGQIGLNGRAEGKPIELLQGQWADGDLLEAITSTIVPFEIVKGTGKIQMVVENNNTMLYLPRCRMMMQDRGVSKSYLSLAESGFTKCPYDATSLSSCNFPECLSKLVTRPQISIPAAKAAFRKSTVVLIRNVKNMDNFTDGPLQFTEGNNHLNLVGIAEAIDSAWSSSWLKNLREYLKSKYGDRWSVRFSDAEYDVEKEITAKIADLESAEKDRKKIVEIEHPEVSKVEQVIQDEVGGSQVAIKKKSTKAKPKAEPTETATDSKV